MDCEHGNTLSLESWVPLVTATPASRLCAQRTLRPFSKTEAASAFACRGWPILQWPPNLLRPAPQ